MKKQTKIIVSALLLFIIVIAFSIVGFLQYKFPNNDYDDNYYAYVERNTITINGVNEYIHYIENVSVKNRVGIKIESDNVSSKVNIFSDKRTVDIYLYDSKNGNYGKLIAKNVELFLIRTKNGDTYDTLVQLNDIMYLSYNKELIRNIR